MEGRLDAGQLAGKRVTTEEPVLLASGLTKSFASPVPVLDEFDLVLQPGEVHALAGGNGSGKSTFIKILSGFHHPDSGSVRLAGRSLKFGSPDSSYVLGCRFMHQDRGLVDSLSVLDNLALGTGFPSTWGMIRGREARRRAADDLARVGLDLDPRRMIGSLSQAEQTAVAVARALHQDSSVQVKLIVLDEPTATLPAGEVRQLLDVVRAVSAGGVAVLYVTHRLDEIFDIAENITVLADGKKVAAVAVKDIDRKQLISLMVGRELEEVAKALDHLPAEHGDPVLRTRGLAAGPLRDLSLDVRAGDIVGLAGITGSGREQVLGAVFGAIARTGGRIEMEGRALPSFRPDLAMRRGMAYLPPDRKAQGAVMALSARENLTIANLSPFWNRLRLRRKPETKETSTWFARMDVRPVDGPDQRLETFSGGNQQKVLLARWLRRNPRVLLLDEPTQGVDIGAKAELHRQILAAVRGGTAAVVSSSDADELAVLCHRVLVLRDGRVAAELSGEHLTAGNIGRESLGMGRAAA